MVLSFHFRLPRPRRFLGLFDLEIGAEVITWCALFNKVSGAFGVLAIFTGAEISALQMSMYIYSLLATGVFLYVLPHLRKQTPLPNLAYAFFYVVDAVISAIYTSLFAVTWFLLVSEQRRAQEYQPISVPAPGVGKAGQMIEDIAGISGGPFNNTASEEGVYPGSGIKAPQDAVGVLGSGMETLSQSATLSNGVMQPESPSTIVILCFFWMIRVYFCLVVLAYARLVVRESATPGAGPFTGRNHGEGLEGRVGRALLSINKSYWEGPTGWTNGGARKFRRSEEPLRRRNSNDIPRELPR